LRNKLISYFKYFSIFISIVAIFIFLLLNFQKCQEINDSESVNYTNLFKYNFLQSDLNIHFEELSIFPEYENLSCLGQIKNLEVKENQNNLLYSEKILDIKIFTSTRLKNFIYTLMLALQITNLKILNKRDNHVISFLYSAVFNLYFFSGIVEFIIFTLVGQIVIHIFYTNIDDFKKIYFSKKFIFSFFAITNFLIFTDMLFEKYFFIGSYLINYKFGFMRRGLLGNIVLFSPFNTLGNIIFICSLLIFLYSLYLYWTYSLLKKADNIYLNLIAFSPLVLFYQFINTTNSVNSNLMGGEFLGLVTVSYAAYIKDKINIKNLIILFCLFNFSIYVHEINLLTVFIIHIILNNKYLTTINFLSISVFLYLYFVNYSKFIDKFEPLCQQFISLKIRKNICLGGLSNATSDQIKFGLEFFSSSKNLPVVLNSSNLSYFISILLFFYFARNLNLSNKITFATISILFVYFPIFLIAVDWGRWLYIIFSLLLILFLVGEDQPNKNINYIDIFIYLVMVFALKHFGTRGLGVVDIEYLTINNCYFILPILFKNFKKK